MPSGVMYLNDEEQMIASERETRKTSRAASCVVNYYRRPRKRINGQPCAQPAWIMTGDATEDAKRDFIYRGFIPLPKYGRVWDEPSDYNGRHFRAYGPMAAILVHPDGPAEFPAEQVITYRWYDKNQLPKGKDNGLSISDQPCEACGSIHRIRFPQIKGETIQEYACPEGCQRTFLRAVYLSRHLRNSHDYTFHDLELLSKKTGVDFDREYRDILQTAVLYDEDDGDAAVPDIDDGVTLEPVRVPGKAEVEAEAPETPEAATAHADGDKLPYGRRWSAKLGKAVKGANWQPA